jgi:hypothetical protein
VSDQSSEAGRVEWDCATAQNHACDIANATATRDEVVLNFGATRVPEGLSAALSAELLRRIALRPMSAKNLLAMLRNMVAEIDAEAQRALR